MAQLRADRAADSGQRTVYRLRAPQPLVGTAADRGLGRSIRGGRLGQGHRLQVFVNDTAKESPAFGPLEPGPAFETLGRQDERTDGAVPPAVFPAGGTRVEIAPHS